jgi:hypothetical protein
MATLRIITLARVIPWSLGTRLSGPRLSRGAWARGCLRTKCCFGGFYSGYEMRLGFFVHPKHCGRVKSIADID